MPNINCVPIRYWSLQRTLPEKWIKSKKFYCLKSMTNSFQLSYFCRLNEQQFKTGLRWSRANCCCCCRCCHVSSSLWQVENVNYSLNLSKKLYAEKCLLWNWNRQIIHQLRIYRTSTEREREGGGAGVKEAHWILSLSAFEILQNYVNCSLIIFCFITFITRWLDYFSSFLCFFEWNQNLNSSDKHALRHN